MCPHLESMFIYGRSSESWFAWGLHGRRRWSVQRHWKIMPQLHHHPGTWNGRLAKEKKVRLWNGCQRRSVWGLPQDMVGRSVFVLETFPRGGKHRRRRITINGCLWKSKRNSCFYNRNNASPRRRPNWIGGASVHTGLSPGDT